VKIGKTTEHDYLFVNALNGIAKYIKEITDRNAKERQVHQVCHIYKRYLFKANDINYNFDLKVNQFPGHYIAKYNDVCGNKSGYIFI
jgi:hypothetical protein